VTGTVPSGLAAMFYIVVNDSAGNASNVVGIPVRF
jgi:hypothetical protein